MTLGSKTDRARARRSLRRRGVGAGSKASGLTNTRTSTASRGRTSATPAPSPPRVRSPRSTRARFWPDGFSPARARPNGVEYLAGFAFRLVSPFSDVSEKKFASVLTVLVSSLSVFTLFALTRSLWGCAGGGGIRRVSRRVLRAARRRHGRTRVPPRAVRFSSRIGCISRSSRATSRGRPSRGRPSRPSPLLRSSACGTRRVSISPSSSSASLFFPRSRAEIAGGSSPRTSPRPFSRSSSSPIFAPAVAGSRPR